MLLEEIVLVLIFLGLLGRMHIALSFLISLSDAGVVIFLANSLRKWPLRRSAALTLLVGILYILSPTYPVSYLAIFLLVSVLCVKGSGKFLAVAVNIAALFSILAIIGSVGISTPDGSVDLLRMTELTFLMNLLASAVALAAVGFALVAAKKMCVAKVLAPAIIILIIFAGMAAMEHGADVSLENLNVSGDLVISGRAVRVAKLTVASNLVLENSVLSAQEIHVGGSIKLRNSKLSAGGIYEGSILVENGTISDLKIINSTIRGSYLSTWDVTVDNCSISVDYMRVYLHMAMREVRGEIGVLDQSNDGYWLRVEDSNMSIGHARMTAILTNSTVRLGWSRVYVENRSSKIIPQSTYRIDFKDDSPHDIFVNGRHIEASGDVEFSAILHIPEIKGRGEVFNDSTTLKIAIDGRNYTSPYYWWAMVYDGDLKVNRTAERILEPGESAMGNSDTIYFFHRKSGCCPYDEIPQVQIEGEVKNITVLGARVVGEDMDLKNSTFYDSRILLKKGRFEDSTLIGSFVQLRRGKGNSNLAVKNSALLNTALIQEQPPWDEFENTSSYIKAEHDWRSYAHGEIRVERSTLFSSYINLYNVTMSLEDTLIMTELMISLSNSNVAGGTVIGGLSGIMFEEWTHAHDNVVNVTAIGYDFGILEFGDASIDVENSHISGEVSAMFSGASATVWGSELHGPVVLYGSNLDVDRTRAMVMCFENSTFSGSAARVLAYNSTMESIVMNSITVNTGLRIGAFYTGNLGNPMLVVFLTSIFLPLIDRRRFLLLLLSPLLFMVPAISIAAFLITIAAILFPEKRVPPWEITVSSAAYLLLFVPVLYSRNVMLIAPLKVLIPVIPFMRTRWASLLGFSLVIIQAIIILLAPAL